VRLVKPEDDVIMLTKNGRAMRFAATDVRRMGRTATGVRGVRLLDGDRVVSLDAVDDAKTLFIATANGYGKRCEFKDFTRHGRGGQGMIGIKGADRNGAVVAAHAVSDDESVISITSDQQMVRSAVSDFSVQGRMAQGVKLVRLSEGATLVSVSVCEGEEEAEKAPVSDGVDQPAAPAEGVAEPPAENSEAPAPSEGDAEPRE
jgi:DNA gyrase subunit A